MKLFKLKGITKKYALRAAHYRRVARKHIPGLDFSENALRALFIYESTGKGNVDKNNGYSYGKFLVDLSVSMWIEDIKAGNACKAEFLSTRLEKLHNTKKLELVPAGIMFCYQKL